MRGMLLVSVFQHGFVFMVLLAPLLALTRAVADDEVAPRLTGIAITACFVIAAVGSWWINDAFKVAAAARSLG